MIFICKSPLLHIIKPKPFVYHRWRIPTKKISVYFSKSKLTHHFSASAMSFYRLQGHEGRSVQFKLSLVSVNFNASCELHRPAFMTLEPIRWHCKFCWELRNDEYNNNIKLITNTTTWRESLTNLAKMNNFWRFGRNVEQYRSPLRTYSHPLISMQ